MSRGIVRPPPAPNWFFNEYHRSHLFNKFPFHQRLYKSASVESCLDSKEVWRRGYSVLGFMVIVLQVLERIGVSIGIGWFAAYASGLGVLLLVSSGNLSIWSWYKF
jgi:hypothetical protein